MREMDAGSLADFAHIAGKLGITRERGGHMANDNAQFVWNR